MAAAGCRRNRHASPLEWSDGVRDVALPSPAHALSSSAHTGPRVAICVNFCVELFMRITELLLSFFLIIFILKNGGSRKNERKTVRYLVWNCFFISVLTFYSVFFSYFLLRWIMTWQTRWFCFVSIEENRNKHLMGIIGNLTLWLKLISCVYTSWLF